MKVFELTIQLMFILILAFMLLYNGFYLMQTKKAVDKMGIALPSTLHAMQIVNLILPLAAIALILFSILFLNIYEL